MAPFPVDPKWGRWPRLCQAWCGRDARAPRKPSSHESGRGIDRLGGRGRGCLGSRPILEESCGGNELVPTHVHPLTGKQDSLLFQEMTLLQGTPRRAGRTGQEASSRPHHPVPGQSRGTAVHGPTHLTGLVGRTEKGGDLPVGQHPPGRNRARHPVHLLEEGSFFRVGQESSLVVGPRPAGRIIQE